MFSGEKTTLPLPSLRSRSSPSAPVAGPGASDREGLRTRSLVVARARDARALARPEACAVAALASRTSVSAVTSGAARVDLRICGNDPIDAVLRGATPSRGPRRMRRGRGPRMRGSDRSAHAPTG